MTLPTKRKIVCIGNYQFTGNRLGEGNFARVEEAIHVGLKTKVAVKVMDASKITEEYVMRNLHREVKLLSKLKHPHIMFLYETIAFETTLFMITELIPGGDMTTFIKTQAKRKLKEDQAKIFGRQIVSAVAYMHNKGIVHRDLKMDNIMLNETKTKIKIVDFGLSNFWTTGTSLKTHCGSPEYAAPELFISKQPYGPSVDLWSVGIILYAMVCGELPFTVQRKINQTSSERRSLLHKMISRGLVSSHFTLLSDLSAELRSILGHLLATNPRKRISILELIRHPWITHLGKKPLCINGYTELDEHWQNSIKQQIAIMLEVNYSEITYAIYNEPYGMTGGYYNILSTRRMVNNEPTHNIPRPKTTSHVSVATVTKLETIRPSTASSYQERSNRSTASANVRPQANNGPVHTAARAALRKSKIGVGGQPTAIPHKEKSANVTRPSNTRTAFRPQLMAPGTNLTAAGDAIRNGTALVRIHTHADKNYGPITHGDVITSSGIAQTISKYMVKQCTWAQDIAKFSNPGRALLGE